MKKSAFTLIELLISIAILSILMLFLYKSYANLNRSNILLHEEV
ncbi:MAG TPA: prepilin-type N-terminal cleavage/methylation domain-containing protein, partial [Sulfurimonas sp.]|nr:prepilin-type N-terminal cleavage/methylation domain-containing protein [Sulfurimonas sp.]